MRPGKYVTGREFAAAGPAELMELAALPHSQGPALQTEGEEKEIAPYIFASQ